MLAKPAAIFSNLGSTPTGGESGVVAAIGQSITQKDL
jgi:hypothetical protein